MVFQVEGKRKASYGGRARRRRSSICLFRSFTQSILRPCRDAGRCDVDAMEALWKMKGRFTRLLNHQASSDKYMVCGSLRVTDLQSGLLRTTAQGLCRRQAHVPTQEKIRAFHRLSVSILVASQGRHHEWIRGASCFKDVFTLSLRGLFDAQLLKRLRQGASLSGFPRWRMSCLTQVSLAIVSLSSFSTNAFCCPSMSHTCLAR